MLPKASIKGKTLRKKKEAVCSNIIKQQKEALTVLSAKASFCYQKIYSFLKVKSSCPCASKSTNCFCVIR